DTTAAACDVGADYRTADRTAGRGDVSAGPAADLVAEYPADDSTDDRAGDVRPTGRLNHLLAFYPAALARRPHDGTHRRDGSLVDPFGRARAIFVGGCGKGLGFVVIARNTFHGAYRGNPVVQTHALERIVTTSSQHYAAPVEARE